VSGAVIVARAGRQDEVVLVAAVAQSWGALFVGELVRDHGWDENMWED